MSPERMILLDVYESIGNREGSGYSPTEYHLIMAKMREALYKGVIPDIDAQEGA